MDYEKKYKEALTYVKYLIEHNVISKENAGKYFPELKESEDERIMKELIAMVRLSCTNGDDADKKIAWLEKKGAQKAKIADFKAKNWYVSKVDGKIYNAKFMEEPLTNQKRRLEIEKAAMSATGIIEQEEWFIKGAEWSDKNPFCISSEKQGEQKPTEEYNITGIGSKHAQGKLGEMIKNLKPVNKALKQKSAWSEEDEEMIDNIIDYMKPMPIFFESTKGKSGKEYTKEFIKNAIKWLKSLKDRVQPQQRQDWKQENIEELSDFENAMMHIGGSFFGENAGLDPNNTACIKEQANLLLELIPKQEWSEEDVRNIQDIDSVLFYDKSLPEDTCMRLRNWLKSLKERVQLQPKQEWSEEEKARIDKIVDVLDWAEEKGYIRYSDWEDYICYVKSLRPQNKYTYNPYKAVVESIAEMCVHYANSSDLEDFYDNVVVKCKEAKEYDSLYPQSTWKPSEEQIEALDRAQAELCSTEYNKPICDLIDSPNKLREE